MNIKQKIIKPKQSDKAKDRYKFSSHNDSTPNMLKSQNHNKQNNYYHINQNNLHPYKFNNVQILKSMQLPKRLKTTTNQDDRCFKRKYQKEIQLNNDLRSSQQIFNFKYKNNIDSTFRQDLTFGLAKNNDRKHLMTSRQYIQQKKLKTQVIDQMILNSKRSDDMMNSKRNLCKSVNSSQNIVCNCANHTNKIAKYRLICQLSQGQQQMFYCSKCAINLLKRGFKIQQIKAQDLENETNLARLKNISKCQLKLKSLQQKSRNLHTQDIFKHDVLMIEQQIQSVNNKYQTIFFMLQQLRKKDISRLTNFYQQKQQQRKTNNNNLQSIQQQIQSIQTQIKELISNNSFLNMNQNQYHFLIVNLNNKINKFQESLASQYVNQQNRHRLSFQIVTNNMIFNKLHDKIKDYDKNYKKSLNSKELKNSLNRQSMKVEESMMTEELKHPFRILFPNDQSQHVAEYKLNDRRGGNNNNMLSSVRQCPSFATYV